MTNVSMEIWEDLRRPGYFGRRRDEVAAQLTREYPGGWRVRWSGPGGSYDFADACVRFYEEAYYQYLYANREIAVWVSQFKDVYDNALTNVHSGIDYRIQEAMSTHIQDIAIRNVLKRLSLPFRNLTGGRLLEIRGRGDGYALSPGRVPFHQPSIIKQPSLAPKWAERGSVEDFWQSNKIIQVRRH